MNALAFSSLNADWFDTSGVGMLIGAITGAVGSPKLGMPFSVGAGAGAAIVKFGVARKSAIDPCIGSDTACNGCCGRLGAGGPNVIYV